MIYRQRLVKLADATAAFDDLVRTQKEAEDDQQKIANVAIAEAPIEPHLTSKPNVMLNLALGVSSAGFLSLGAAFAAEYFRDSVEQPRELEGFTGLPVRAISYDD